MHPIASIPFAGAASLLLLLLSIAPRSAFAESDKSKFHLFNPTPNSEMREFATDRPDRTESPITVDAGHFQIETDLVLLTLKEGQRSTVYNYMNLKAGITNNSDLQVLIPSLVRQNSQSGFGNTTIRYKINFFGNDAGSAALGIMPYITLPTQSSTLGTARTEGGVLLPFGFDGPQGYSIGGMIQYDRVRNTGDNGFHSQFISTLALSRGLFAGLEGYLEIFSQTEAGADWVATLDGGIILPVTDNLRFDVGANVGVTDAAEDISPFLGLSARF
jgi:hypothetical protein